MDNITNGSVMPLNVPTNYGNDFLSVNYSGDTAKNAYHIGGQNGQSVYFGSIGQRWFDKSTVDLVNNALSVQAERDFNSREAQKNRDFQERMSNTAYSRAVQDLKSAGLNPYLALGSGASSSPSGSTASSGSGYARSDNSFARDFLKLVGTAISVAVKGG